MDKLLRVALAAMELGAHYENAHARFRPILTAVVAGWVAAAFGILALLWFDAALWFYCQPRLGAPVAALIAGGALLLLALIALLPIALLRSGGAQAPADGVGAGALAAGAARELNELVRGHKGAIMIAAALAGLVLGSTPRRP